jgi:hypothetical protein
MTESSQETVSRIYNCPKCKKTHRLTLEKKIAEGRRRYPFPHVFLHSVEENFEDLLTILYIDAQLQIRAVDIIELEHSNIFSEDMAKEIMDKLMDEMLKLQEENFELKGLLSKIEISESIEIEEDEVELEPIPMESKDDVIAEEEEGAEFNEVSENIWTIKSKTPGRKIRAKGEMLDLYFISTIGPGEKKQKLTINTGNVIYEIKETIGHIYGLIPANFHLSVGGVTLDEMILLKEYKISDGDEVLIIPASVAGIES